MHAALDASRLNVTEKTRANLFSWRGQFTPQFVDYLLETHAVPGQVVLDPFCGSGTVLQEAATHNLSAIGLEINPAAYAMAKFFALSHLTATGRKRLIEEARQLINSHVGLVAHDLPLFNGSADYRENASNLLDFARGILNATREKQTRLLLLLTLFRSEGGANGALATTVVKAFTSLSEDLLRLPISHQPITAVLSDARCAHEGTRPKADIIITSPPYINVFNYHQNYRAVLELVGFDMLEVAKSEIGSNRKHRANRFFTVVQYCLDLEESLKSFANAMVPNGQLIMVLGRESRVRGIPFGNARIAERLLDRVSAYSPLTRHERVFVNRFGQSIYEDILVAKRVGEPTHETVARDVATDFLKKALGHDASRDVSNDIREALSFVSNIKSSPLLNKDALI